MAKKMSDSPAIRRPQSAIRRALHDVLIKGEADRAKLTSPRWQAEFDLAFGRVLAIKARLDGYNSMIAALKRGKTFQKVEAKPGFSNPADNFETESTIKKSADKAKQYLGARHPRPRRHPLGQNRRGRIENAARLVVERSLVATCDCH